MQKIAALSNAILSALPLAVARPRYSRASLSAGIVHFGIGNFHRAHLAVYLDDLFNEGLDHDWAIIGAGVTPSDEAMQARLAQQDYLTTVIEQDADRSTARVIGSMIDFIPPSDTDRLHATLIDPAIRIVSLTITEGGYFLNAATGAIQVDHPDLVHDERTPDAPRTVFGHITKALRFRHSRGIAPFTVLSCDNVPHNGAVVRAVVIAIAGQANTAFARWIETEVSFPNAMVDRITPATGERERAAVVVQFGIADRAPVFCEPFRQWVLQDRFPAGRPAFDRVGATFVEDVTAHEQMKLRVLNGSHAAIAYPAALLDIHYVHDAMQTRAVRRYLDKLARDEVIPTVPPPPNTDIGAYFDQIVHRFANPKIADTIARLCMDGASRQPKYILGSIRDRLNADASVDGLALESALWCRFCTGRTDSGKVTEPSDKRWSDLTRRAAMATSDPDAWLGIGDVYGETGRHPRFREAFAHALGSLGAKGTLSTLQAYADGEL